MTTRIDANDMVNRIGWHQSTALHAHFTQWLLLQLDLAQPHPLRSVIRPVCHAFMQPGRGMVLCVRPCHARFYEFLNTSNTGPRVSICLFFFC
jgi:hypothetical protein